MRAVIAMRRSIVPLPRHRSLRGPLPYRLVLLLLPSVLLFSTIGCGEKGGAKNSVSGKVLFNSKPVTGTVTFIGADGKEAASPINPDGSYNVPDPPLGEDKITIQGIPGMADAPRPQIPTTNAPGMDDAMKKSLESPSSSGVAPPAKYASPTNGLTFKVTGGKQTFNIDLKP